MARNNSATKTAAEFCCGALATAAFARDLWGVGMLVDIYEREHRLLPIGYIHELKPQDHWYAEPSMEELKITDSPEPPAGGLSAPSLVQVLHSA